LSLLQGRQRPGSLSATEDDRGRGTDGAEKANDCGARRKVVERRDEQSQNITRKADGIAAEETKAAWRRTRRQRRHDQRGEDQKDADQLNRGGDRHGKKGIEGDAPSSQVEEYHCDEHDGVKNQ